MAGKEKPKMTNPTAPRDTLDDEPSNINPFKTELEKFLESLGYKIVADYRVAQSTELILTATEFNKLKIGLEALITKQVEAELESLYKNSYMIVPNNKFSIMVVNANQIKTRLAQLRKAK